ncbi:DUF6252 family protein [Polaribacter sp. BM10]|uniref:DUF6252 family protein n=1 Tax=Polaribacter sp. BM10 TaxID=1529069 RepID=UPI0011EA5961|nr:DUF6252 family protein [Polaribacter sp. BM10]
MKVITKSVLIFSVLICLSSCESLFGDGEDDFSCDKNATVILNGDEKCAYAKSLVKAGRLQIGFGYSTGAVDLLINEENLKENVTYTYAKGEVTVWFNNLNKVKSGLFMITKLDEENRLMSGQFDFNAESNNNSQAFDYAISARFTDVSY